MIFEAASKGVIKINVLAASAQCAGNTLNVLAMPASKITSPAALAGKCIAVNLTGNIQTLTIDAVLKGDGVNPATIKYVEIPFPSMPAALAAGRVDAISDVEPFITAADELMLTTMVYDIADRIRSFELVTEKVAAGLRRPG